MDPLKKMLTDDPTFWRAFAQSSHPQDAALASVFWHSKYEGIQ